MLGFEPCNNAASLWAISASVISGGGAVWQAVTSNKTAKAASVRIKPPRSLEEVSQRLLLKTKESS